MKLDEKLFILFAVILVVGIFWSLTTSAIEQRDWKTKVIN